MAKETKTVSLRLPMHVVEYLEKKDSSINQAVIDAVDKLLLIEKYADRDIRGVFSKEEWSFLADSLNGTIVEGDFRYYSASLIAHIEDSVTYDGLDIKWNIDTAVLISKVKRLSSSAIDAIYRRIESYWNAPVDLDKWAEF